MISKTAIDNLTTINDRAGKPAKTVMIIHEDTLFGSGLAKLLNEQEVDIAVDLKGLTLDCRPGIFAHRPAPIQVSYLGYPGTMGADFIDYVIADTTVLPLDQQPFWTERIVDLPDCYQVNDSKRQIAPRVPTRREAELPDRGFVFCCFNSNWKITPPFFDVWMRLLQAIENNVLWLMRSSIAAEINLRNEAEARGIDPKRLVFAANLPLKDHLARHRSATAARAIRAQRRHRNPDF